VTDGIGAPGVRGVVTLAYTTGAPAATLHSRRPPAVELDTDHDGVSDAVDRCPTEPENRDGFQDDDGCPEPDGDRDGIADAIDKCPGEAEDRDGFQDDDGCPDPDNDRDGIADAADKCPDEPEVVNGLDDEDGCPDVVDSADRASVLKAAQAMFDKGRALFAAGNYPQACETFEQSHRLDPQFGTQFNIAGCYEKIGKLASAWHLYRGLSRSDPRLNRRAQSKQLAIALGPRVPKIKLVVRRRPADVHVLLDDVDATTQIGVETPMDRGSYTVTATAAGYRAWSKTVEVKDDSKVITVVIDLQASP
jgi:tetratricopeptide (TPR) repeat protein